MIVPAPARAGELGGDGPAVQGGGDQGFVGFPAAAQVALDHMVTGHQLREQRPVVRQQGFLSSARQAGDLYIAFDDGRLTLQPPVPDRPCERFPSGA